MTIIVLVPDWTATEAMRKLAESRAGLRSYQGTFMGRPIEFAESEGCDVIYLKVRLETMPADLAEVPMRAIHLVKHNSPVTFVGDGLYVDGSIVARVETYIKDGVTQQSFRVRATNSTTVEDLNQWFDDLLAGLHADKLTTNPITYPVPTEPTTQVADAVLTDTTQR